MLKKSKLVLCIDLDNDLYEKAGLSGPIIGREANLNAAIKLGLADPAETDTNSILTAIQIHDKLSKEYNVQIVTLTGSAKLGFEADEAISQQLDRVIAEFPCDSCVFVSDGASDESIMPIIRSRLKIDSVALLVMKQAKELEKTYFVILEKLKEPYYARLIFGIPALIMLFLALGSYFHIGWQPLVVIVALYFIARAFGIEEAVSKVLSTFEFSVERISVIAYIIAFLFMVIGAWIGLQSYNAASVAGLDGAKTLASVVRAVLSVLPWTFILLIMGKVADLINEKRKIEITKYALYATIILLFNMVFSVGVEWILNDSPKIVDGKAQYVYFGDFVVTMIAAVVLGFAAIELIRRIKRSVIISMKLENKEVLGTSGNYMGKVMGIDTKDGALAVRSALGQKFIIPIESIERVGDKIIVDLSR